LVLEAAVLLCDRVQADFGLQFDRDRVLVGAAAHDAGKIVHPEEMTAPGHLHERAGERLLLAHGVPAAVARFCITHAMWDAPDVSVEDLLVALADKLWKGKREDDLERRVADAIKRETNREAWKTFDVLDAICESIAAGGPERLARSSV
jgi:HD domain